MSKDTYTLTDSPVRKNKIAREERERLIKDRLAHRKKMKSDQFKVDTVKTFILLGGNASLTAAAMGISRPAIENWKRTSWWDKLLKEFRKEERLEVSTKARKIIEKSLEELADRLDKGDYIYDAKQGTMVRKPVSAKELNRISIDMMERKDKIDRAIDQGTSKEDTEEDKLAKLAEQFAQLAIKAVNKKPTIEVTDVVFVEEKKNA